MPDTRAADLPTGSVVSAERTTYVKDHPTATAAWRGTRGGHHGDWEVDKALAGGAQVLRVGYDRPALLAENDRLRRELAANEGSEDARLAIAEKALRDANDTIIGVVENGSWATDPDPVMAHRARRYVADGCYAIATDAGLTEAAEVCRRVLRGEDR